jgi:lipid-binding SYLF domain-containing protein
MCQARAVFIMPKLIKGGFVVVGEGGNGVLIGNFRRHSRVRRRRRDQRGLTARRCGVVVVHRLYGGLTVDGSVIRAEPNMDLEFYGRPVTSRDVLLGHAASPRASALRREMDRFG